MSPIRRTTGRREGRLSLWFLFALPILFGMILLAVNAEIFAHARQVNQNITDASALAAAQSMVVDEMLVGTDSLLDIVELEARIQAQQYSNFNPIQPLPITYDDADITYTRIPHPLNPLGPMNPTGVQLIETVQVIGKRGPDTANPVPVIGGGFFGVSAISMATMSKATLNRNVSGFRPAFFNNIPVAPLAIPTNEWTSEVEAKFTSSPPTSVATLPTLELKICAGGSTGMGCDPVYVLKVGTTTIAQAANQMDQGISAGELNGAPFKGQLLNGVSVGTFGEPDAATLAALAPKLTSLKATGQKMAFPLIPTSAADPGSTTISRFVAARVLEVTYNSMATPANIELKLVPTFLSGTSVQNDVTQPINPYLARVRLTFQ